MKMTKRDQILIAVIGVILAPMISFSYRVIGTVFQL